MTREGIEQIWDSGLASTSKPAERYLEAVERYSDKFEVVFPVAGEEYAWGEYCTTHVLNPPQGYLPGQDLNENSLVLRVTCNGASFMLTGDAGAQAESNMLEKGYELASTVLKLGHHGSRSSTTDSFLDRVSPQIAVISAPQSSRYGHPHDEILDRLCERGITTYWTGIHGTITITADAQGAIGVTTEREATTDPCEMSGLKE
jgi:competence protein ComEC